jgi:SNF2 family DNA or RNA helicase
MIPPSAIQHYLDRDLDDNRALKDLTHGQIDDMFAELEEPPVFWHSLMLHQKVCLYLGLKHGNFCFWCDMGTGKTLVALELLQHYWSRTRLRRALVFVTSDKAFPTWEKQIKNYKIDVPYVVLDAQSSEIKWSLLDNFKEGIVLLHYPGTVHMVSEKVRSVTKSGKVIVKMEIVPEKMDRLLRSVDALVLDESTKCGNHQSLTYDIALAASRKARYRFALAGMPFGRDPGILWPQMKLVDAGETLGQTLGLYREVFFTKHLRRWGGPFSFDYRFKKKMHGELSRILQHRSITYSAAECIELPEVSHLLEYVTLSREAMDMYHGYVQDIIKARGNYHAVENAFLRMRQLSSGFLGLKDDDTGDKAEMDFDDNPKLDRLMELIDELPFGAKALVFYDYTHSGRRITETLHAAKIKHIWLWSGTKDTKGALAGFTEGDAQIAVLNNKVGAYSLDGMQVANYEFHFESALSVIDRSQAEKRIVRQGQMRKCFIYDLVAADTVDEKILEFHREGKSLFDSLLGDPQKVLALTRERV